MTERLREQGVSLNDRLRSPIGLGMARLWKLLTLVAVLLLPFGMQPAAASPKQHHQPNSAAMLAEHCPDGATPDSKGHLALCTMICSAALPAADAPQAQPMIIVCEPAAPGLSQRLSGHDPDIATPPPKRS
jgi:hypothetical protein